jgi:ketosteroid isomerase-like protein
MSAEDRENIRELFAAYATAMDTMDWTAVGDCFAPEATAQYGDFSEVLKGREKILDHMTRTLGVLDACQHMFTNFLIKLDGDTGHVVATVLGQHIRRGFPGGEHYWAGNRYDADVRRDADRWRFTRVFCPAGGWGEGNRDLLPHA